MKKHVALLGIGALTLSLASLPLVALARDGEAETETTVSARVDAGATVSASATSSARIEAEDEDQNEVQSGNQDEDQNEYATTTARGEERAREAHREAAKKQLEMLEKRIELNLDASSTAAISFEDLKRMIERRKEELDQEEASTTRDNRDIVEHANEVRLAVHSLLASKELLGGIGPQVSAIAREVNNSLATTTNAEAEIKARGFWKHLLFGGDVQVGDMLAAEVQKDQNRVVELTNLLGQASTTADVKAELQLHIDALNTEIARLQTLATKEQSQQGILGWLFK